MNDTSKTSWLLCVGLYESAHIISPENIQSIIIEHGLLPHSRHNVIIKYTVTKEVTKKIDNNIIKSLKNIKK